MEWTCLGHEKQKRYFEKVIAAGALAHAYLLTGPEMIGKRLVAEDVARALIPAGHELDMLRLSPERDPETGKVKDIPIDAIRDLKSWIILRPFGQCKFILIDDADRLGEEAANTLLKVLEEPPSYAHFLLVTSKPGQVMATISSRCEHIDFSPLGEKDMTKILAGFKLSADDKELLGAVAGGRPGLATELIKEKKLTIVAKAIANLQKALKSGVAERLIYAKKLADDENVVQTVGWWLSYVHSRLTERPQLASLATGLMELSGVLIQPQYNRRLAIEHFLLSQALPK